MQEKAEVTASLAAAGFTADDSDIVLHQGRWSLGGGRGWGAASHPSSANTAAALRKIETEIRTLYISPHAQLTAAERKEQEARSKHTPTKRKACFPGDDEVFTTDRTPNPFTDWPWEQTLRVAPDLPYRQAGRLIRNMLRWCNASCTCTVMRMTHRLHTHHGGRRSV